MICTSFPLIILFDGGSVLTECGIELLSKTVELHWISIEDHGILLEGERSLRYNEFFRAFYIGEGDGFLRHNWTTQDIPEFFARIVLTKEEHLKILPTDPSSYDKWFQGSASPRRHWGNMSKDFNEDRVVDALMKELDDTRLPDLLGAFGIKDRSEIVNKELLCTAIAQQFKAIIDGKGEGRDVLADIYLSGNINAAFMDYIRRASARYNVMKLIGGEEVPLEDYFVCNTIGVNERVFADKKKITGETRSGDELTLKSIRDIFQKRRGYDNRLTVLIGGGGCGKSLVLQHMFLKASTEYEKTGVLPVFLELRHYVQNTEIMAFIVDSVSALDNRFTEDDARRLLLAGRCQLLLDGFDEIDPSDIDSFVKKMQDFALAYENVQIVVTSRENENLKGLRGFTRLYVWPFDTEQSMKLIDKILLRQGQIEEKEAVVNYIEHGFLQKDGIFAAHPLLLTYVTQNYPSLKRFRENHISFYRSMFDALLSGHDENKKPYDRVFKSVDNADQFKIVFREFCAISFKDAVFFFPSTLFEEYFNRLERHKNFENPKKMNITNFKHDVISTACMMYEKSDDIYYIDPGFQEFLFAEYYAQAEKDETQELLESLCCISSSKYLRYDAFDMLFHASEIKFKMYVLLPFLDKIFNGNNEDQFINFLSVCFDKISFIVFDKKISEEYLYKLGFTSYLYPQIMNDVSTVLLDYILRLLEIEQVGDFSLYANKLDSEDTTEIEINEETEVTGILVGRLIEESGVHNLLIEFQTKQAYDLNNKAEQKGEKTGYLVDENNVLVTFGSRYTIDTYYLSEDKKKNSSLINSIRMNSDETCRIFQKLKDFHKQLRLEKYHSRIR